MLRRPRAARLCGFGRWRGVQPIGNSMHRSMVSAPCTETAIMMGFPKSHSGAEVGSPFCTPSDRSSRVG
jgi:hypothetical protein